MFGNNSRKGIRYKFLRDISIILFFSTCALSTLIAVNEGRMLKHSLTTKGQSFASYIAKLSQDPLITKDSIQLDSFVNEAKKDEDIIFIIIQDAEGNFITSQYASINYRSEELRGILAGLPKESELLDIIAAIKKKEVITELSVPILSGTVNIIGKVTIGMSQNNIRKQILKTILFIILLNVIAASVLGTVLFIASRKTILDPIIELGHAAARLAKGDLSTHVKVKATGEIQTLVNSFNQMAEDLEKTTVSKEYVDNIINSMNDTLLVVSPEGDIMRSNASACALLEYEENELIGQPVGMVFYEGLSGTDSVINDASTYGGIRNIEKICLSRDGKKIPVLFSASAMRDENNRIQGIVCVAQDITERKQIENERERLIDELQKALVKVKQLSGLLPICASCKKVRDDSGYWKQIEEYIRDHSEAEFSHSICPECFKKLYPEY